MNEVQYRISAGQLQRMIILETGSVGCLFVTFWSGGVNGLPVVLLSIIGSLLYGGILMAIGRADGGYVSMTENYMSGFIWRIIWCIYIVRFIIRGAWLLSYMEYLIRETLYPGGRYMILLPLLLVCGYAGVRSLTGRARFVELLFWWVVLPLVVLFLAGIWKIDLRELEPARQPQAGELLWDGYRLMGLFLPLEFLLFRMSAIEDSDRKAWLAGFRGILCAGGWMLLVYTVTVGIIGRRWGQQELLSVTDAMEMISIRSGGLERLDVFLLLFWLVGGIITISAYIFQGQQLLRRIFAGQCTRIVAVLLMLGGVFSVYYCIQEPQQWCDWYWKYACYVDFPISILLPGVIWLNYRVGRKHRKYLLLCLLVAGSSMLTGCVRQDAIEERAYVKYLYVREAKEAPRYQYTCQLSYTGSEASDYAIEDETSYVTAAGIQAVDEAFHTETGSSLDYSHLQGVYLEETIYTGGQADVILNDIRQETQAVLSTPVYQLGLDIGEQPPVNLGEWLKEASKSE